MSFGAQKKSAKEEAYFLLILTPTTKEMADFAQKNDLEDKKRVSAEDRILHLKYLDTEKMRGKDHNSRGRL